MTKQLSGKNRPINFAVLNARLSKEFVMDLKINFDAVWQQELANIVYEQVNVFMLTNILCNYVKKNSSH